MSGLTPTPYEEILDDYRSQVDELRDMVKHCLPKNGETADGVETDDLFLLRYILSNKKSLEKCAKKIEKTLEWRSENKDLLCKLASGEPHPLEKDLSQFLFSGYTGSLPSGEPISAVRMGLSDFRTLMNMYSVDVVADYLLYEKEKMFRFCDDETRKRGHLVKSITVIDFDQFSMFGSRFSKAFFTALGDSSKSSSIYFPQLQAKSVAINTPSYYGAVHSMLQAVMPKSSMEKMVVCKGKSTSSKSASACPFMTKYDGLDAVPDFLGGTGKTPRELLAPEEREGEVPMKTTTIKARSYALLELPIEEPETHIEFEIKVESFHIYMEAELLRYSEDQEKEMKIEHHKRSKKKRRGVRSAKPASDDAAKAMDKQAKRFSLNPTMVQLKLNSKDGIVKGSWKIPMRGRLLIKLDNTFSVMRSKKVTYRITTVPPPEDEEELSWWNSNWGDFAGQANWPSNADDDWSCTIS